MLYLKSFCLVTFTMFYYAFMFVKLLNAITMPVFQVSKCGVLYRYYYVKRNIDKIAFTYISFWREINSTNQLSRI